MRFFFLFFALAFGAPGAAYAEQAVETVELRIQFENLNEYLDRGFDRSDFSLLIGTPNGGPRIVRDAERMRRSYVSFEVEYSQLIDGEPDCIRVSGASSFVYARCFVDVSELRFSQRDGYFSLTRTLHGSCAITHPIRNSIRNINWQGAPTTPLDEWSTFSESMHSLFAVQRGNLHHEDLFLLSQGVTEAARNGQMTDANYLLFPLLLDHDVAARGSPDDRSLAAKILYWAVTTGLREDYVMDDCAPQPRSTSRNVAQRMREVYGQLTAVDTGIYVTSGLVDSHFDFYFNLMRGAIIMLEFDEAATASGYRPIWSETIPREDPLSALVGQCMQLLSTDLERGRECRRAVAALASRVPWDVATDRALYLTQQTFGCVESEEIGSDISIDSDNVCTALAGASAIPD